MERGGPAHDRRLSIESTPEDDDHPSSAEHGLTESQDAHGLVRPDRWGTVLGAAGSLALAVVLRGLRRR